MPGKEIKFAQMQLNLILANKRIISNNHMTLYQWSKTSQVVIKSGVMQYIGFDSLQLSTFCFVLPTSGKEKVNVLVDHLDS